LDERGFLPEQSESQNGASAEEPDTTLTSGDIETDAPLDEESEVPE
jgi:hypothetical protein